jgi:Tol biopolymer transport system component
VYVVAALGGGARLIASDGLMPRFSPDGQSIAFWTGGWLAPRSVGNVRRTYVVPAAGGMPIAVGTNLASIGDPVWFPDGRALLVYGRRSIEGPDTTFDWWRVPIDGTAVTSVGAHDAFRTNRIRVDNTVTHPFPHAWLGDTIVFTAQLLGADSSNLWQIGFDRTSNRVSGAPVRLTNGTTLDSWPAVAPSGLIVFAALRRTELLFSIPLDGNAAKPLGPLNRVREDDTPTQRSSISEDGTTIAFPKYEFGAGGLWARDVRTGQERELAATPRTPLNPVVSVDGRWVGYTVTTTETGGNSGPGAGFVVHTSGGVPQKVCENCEINLLTRDNRYVIVTEPDRKALFKVDVQTHQRTPLVVASTPGIIDRPMIGPNSRWLTFNRPEALYLAPLLADRAATQAEWTPIVQIRSSERSAGMSPDGRFLYLLLERDGFRCLYALRLDPATGHPNGEPFVVAHFHDQSKEWGTTGLGSAVTKELFLASLFETTGNIWMTTVGTRQRK